MRIDHLVLEELDKWDLPSKAMAILTDIQEISKNNIEKKTNVLERFEIPFKSAFVDFFNKEGKEIAEKSPDYLNLLHNEVFQQKIIDFSFGNKKTERKTNYFKDAFEEYIRLVEKKKNKAPEKEKKEKGFLGKLNDSKLIPKIKDLVEFIYIYRYNTKNTEKVLEFLNSVYQKKYGPNFLQDNMDLYQFIETEIEGLGAIENKMKSIETSLKEDNYTTIHLIALIYWFYARADLASLMLLLEKIELDEVFREYIIELILKRCEMKSEDEKIQESFKKAKEMIKDIINKLNNNEIPVVSKGLFEKLIMYGIKYFPNFFELKVVSRIRQNVYNYIKAEKIKNG
ncbi:MAG TPA: hypothetical protein DHW82_01185 [Spirochaetia bacterium]|nr:MAG: hypothetical protein A2Y41_04650 [Spirochaetes bacterium GWB1_36_13]HCL55610.1 hypothetical protein [Spirochaetia bacterium]